MHLLSHVLLLRLCARDQRTLRLPLVPVRCTDDAQGLVRGGVPVQPAHWNVAASRCTSRGDVEALLTLMQQVGAAADVDLFRRLQQIGTTTVSAPT